MANQLFEILIEFPNDSPEILSIMLATMFQPAAAGRLDESFFDYGFRIQRALGERGELQASQIICNALLALNPRSTDSFRLTLSLGTTLFRQHDWHMASGMYEKARQTGNRAASRTNVARAFHGLGACKLKLHQVAEAAVLTQSACDLYLDEAPELYHLALQNLAIAHQLNRDHMHAKAYLEQCAIFWTDHKNSTRVEEIASLLANCFG
jgi:tetratricopeptide (TPR) repeat protein